MTQFQPRPEQQAILRYAGGKMGVSAVPGSGKTYVLAVLAAQLVRDSIDDDQEVLIVTLVNSAVENIKSRVSEFIGTSGLLTNIGYRVRTLHGLAHDIVRERPGLVGLADDFEIVDERSANQIHQDVVDAWLQSHPQAANPFLNPELSESRHEWVIKQQWPNAVRSLTTVFIQRAKDLGQSPDTLQAALQSRSDRASLSLSQMATEIFADYQRALHYRGGVDFDDLIRLADQALQLDPDLLDRLRRRWPFVLEDEAQDSSLQQEKILQRIVGPMGNWVRVGDPNQAINTTFTTADPRFLRQFLEREDVISQPLGCSGRSQRYIVDLANYLVSWTMADHPEPHVRDALYAPPKIVLTPSGDPQPNPEADASGIHLVDRSFSPNKEIEAVVKSVDRWLKDHPQQTAAILVPRNDRGFQMTDALKRAGIPYIELLRSTTSTRKTAGALGNVLKYLSKPTSAPLLSRAFEVWRRDDRDEAEPADRLQRLSALIRKCRHVEHYLWPRPGRDWLDTISWKEDAKQEPDRTSLTADESPTHTDRIMLETFRDLIRRWQEATILPVDQLILTIAQDLFIEPSELALSHKLATMLRAASENNPGWRLPVLTIELAVIARNQRRFLGFDQEENSVTAERGKVTVSTLHKAKGLEWDRVYIMAVNNYNFPSAQPHDQYIGEKWFIRDRLNLEAEVLAQLRALTADANYAETVATYRARLDYVRERLRLLYVGITRAKKELVMTWNTGRSRETKQIAVPFIALHTWWEEQERNGND